MKSKKKPDVNFPPDRPTTNTLRLYNEEKLRSEIESEPTKMPKDSGYSANITK